MSEHLPLGEPRDVAAWLGEGPDRAPSDLLARSMATVAVTRQRRAVVAAALGAPAIHDSTNRRGSLRLLVAAALLVLAAILVIVVAGAWHRQPLITTVLPPSPPATVFEDTPIPSDPVPTEPPPFAAGQNVSVAWSPINPWTKVRAIPGGLPTILVDHLREVLFDTCINQCTGPFTIDFTVGTIDQGIVYGGKKCPNPADALGCAIYQAEGGSPITLVVKGTTTDELAEAWQAEFGTPQQQQSMIVNDNPWQILIYENKSVGVVAKGSRVVAVTVVAQGGLPTDAVPIMLMRFLPAIQFGAEPNPGLLPPVTATLGDLTLTMPSNFAANAGPATIRINEDRGHGDFLVIDDRITLLKPGASMRIERYGGGTPVTFEVTGATLEAIRRSITRGLGDSGSTVLRIGDAQGYRWNVGQASIMHPLVAVAVIEWKGSFYVFEEHFPLDGMSAGNFDLVLQGVTLH